MRSDDTTLKITTGDGDTQAVTLSGVSITSEGNAIDRDQTIYDNTTSPVPVTGDVGFNSDPHVVYIPKMEINGHYVQRLVHRNTTLAFICTNCDEAVYTGGFHEKLDDEGKRVFDGYVHGHFIEHDCAPTML